MIMIKHIKEYWWAYLYLLICLMGIIFVALVKAPEGLCTSGYCPY